MDKNDVFLETLFQLYPNLKKCQERLMQALSQQRAMRGIRNLQAQPWQDIPTPAFDRLLENAHIHRHV